MLSLHTSLWAYVARELLQSPAAHSPSEAIPVEMWPNIHACSLYEAFSTKHKLATGNLSLGVQSLNHKDG